MVSLWNEMGLSQKSTRSTSRQTTARQKELWTELKWCSWHVGGDNWFQVRLLMAMKVC